MKPGCSPEEHWLPTWALNHIDWGQWRAAMLRDKAQQDANSGEPAVRKPFDALPDFQAVVPWVLTSGGGGGAGDRHSGAGNWSLVAPAPPLSNESVSLLLACARLIQKSSSLGANGHLALASGAGGAAMSDAVESLWRTCYLARLAEQPPRGVYCVKDNTLAKQLATVDRTLQGFAEPEGDS